MEVAALYELFAAKALVVAFSTIRLTTAYLVTPLFSDEIVPPLVRNAVFVTIAILVAFVQPDMQLAGLTPAIWLGLFAKEVFIGVAIGFFLGLFLWAFEAAGVIIDTQIGASMAMVYDPISGHEVTLYGDFIGRWVNYLFLASGGLLFLSLSIIESYSIWPVDRLLPDLQGSAVALFEDRFGEFITLTLMIAAPIIVAVFIVDMCMGLINRFAKRLDILFISMAIKGLVTVLMMTVMIPVLVEVFLFQLQSNREGLGEFMRQILGVG